jgi:hypothetical protein
MKSWRDTILDEFNAGIGHLTLVFDADNLFSEEQLVNELRARGYGRLDYDDAIDFRYRYETEYRAAWDRGETPQLIVVIPQTAAESNQLPYDLLQIGRTLSFALSDIVAPLSAVVVSELDRSLLDRVWELRARGGNRRMSDNETRDLLLERVFNINLDRLSGDAELLRMLVQLHYRGMVLPAGLVERLCEIISKHDQQAEQWPLQEIIGNAATFYAFLQERWPYFLRSYALTKALMERQPARELRLRGPQYLPFDDSEVRPLIDNLFIEGKLTPVTIADIDLSQLDWVRFGIVDEHDRERAQRLLEKLQESLPADGVGYRAWLEFAQRWAELGALVHGGQAGDYRAQTEQLGREIDTRFNRWLQQKYGSLTTVAAQQPLLVHQIADRLKRVISADPAAKVALLVIDGLALEQWVTLRRALSAALPDYIFDETATFAWIPTLTNISRQAIFAGKIPRDFANTFDTTASEDKLWRAFWERLPGRDVVYRKSLGDGSAQAVLDETIESNTRVAGLVIDTIDSIMHGMELGAEGMHSQLQVWLQRGFLSALIRQLTERGFTVYLTADHGNLECRGCGAPREGVLAEQRGQRVRIYSDNELRKKTAAAFPTAHSWQPVGLPQEKLPLLAGYREAFINRGERVVAHGGSSLEEVIVPYVRIWKPGQV